MTFVIASPCIDVCDTACQDVCPVDCIYWEPDVDRQLFIAPEECIDCAACEPVCPVTAIFADAMLPAHEQEFLELNARYFEDKPSTRRRVDEIAETVNRASTQEAPSGTAD